MESVEWVERLLGHVRYGRSAESPSGLPFRSLPLPISPSLPERSVVFSGLLRERHERDGAVRLAARMPELVGLGRVVVVQPELRGGDARPGPHLLLLRALQRPGRGERGLPGGRLQPGAEQLAESAESLELAPEGAAGRVGGLVLLVLLLPDVRVGDAGAESDVLLRHPLPGRGPGDQGLLRQLRPLGR